MPQKSRLERRPANAVTTSGDNMMEDKSMLREGYQYLLIKDVQKVEGAATFKHIVQPVRQMPAIAIAGCTWIEDGMICSVIDNPSSHIHIYIDRSNLFLL